MRTSCHRVCGLASPGGEEAVEMASDRQLVRDEGNLACIDAAGSANDDTTAGRESHLTHPFRYRDRRKNPQRMSPPMNYPETTTRPLTLLAVIPQSSGEARSREQHIQLCNEQTVERSAHLEMLAHLFGKRTKSDAGKVIDREAHVFWVIQREHASTQCLDLGIRKMLFKVGRPMLSVTSCIMILT